MREYYQKSWMKVVELLGSNVYKGLIEYDCILRREKYGDNKVTIPNKKSLKRFLLDRIISWNSLVYLVICIIFIIKKKYLFLFVEIMVFLLGILHTFWTSMKNKKNIELLRNLNTTDVLVLREGIERIIKSEELVIGDIVLFKKNSFISADLRIISSKDLKVDERSITGDKILKDKHEAMIDHNVASLSDISNILFKGSVIKRGSGSGVVIATGMNTHLGNLLSSLDKYELKKSSGFKEIDSNINKLNIIGILLTLILASIIPGKSIIRQEVLLSCIFISTALIYPIIYYIYEKSIVKEFEKREIYLNSIFSLRDSDEVKVVFVEKNGSITKEKAEVHKMFFNESTFSIKDVDKKNTDLLRLIDISCITSDIYKEIKDENDIFGEAYIKFCDEHDFGKSRIIQENRFRFRTEINSTDSIRTTVTKNSRGFRATSRGTLDKIIPKCTSVLINGVEHFLTEEEINKIKLADLCFAREGLITEALAYRRFNYEPSKEENIESNMVLVGLIGIKPELSDEIEEDIEELFDKGVLPLVFCEDNKITAEILGRKIGLISSSKEVTSGVELSHMSEDEFYKTVSKSRIFCRLKPEQKLKIVNAFYSDGFKVAVEGETLGDLSIISMSNIGIGKSKAPKILKKICDMYTEKSSIKTLLISKKRGKEIRNSIEKAGFVFIQFILAQIFAMYAYYFIDDAILFSNKTLVVLSLLAIPLILIVLNNTVKEESKKGIRFLHMITYIGFSIIPILPMEENTEIAVFSVLVLNMLLQIFIDFKKDIFKVSNIIYILLYITMFIIGIVLIYKSSSIIVNGALLAIISIFVVFYVLTIWFIRKWQ